jgi:hypothetical protein
LRRRNFSRTEGWSQRKSIPGRENKYKAPRQERASSGIGKEEDSAGYEAGGKLVPTRSPLSQE